MDHDSKTTSAGDLALLDCAEVRELVHRFVTGDDARVPAAQLRAHLAYCAACRDAYRTAVMTVAQLARARRASQLEDSPARTALTATVLGSWPRNRRKLGLSRGQGAFLVLGFVALVSFLAPSAPRAGVEFVPLGGVAWAGQERIDDTSQRRLLDRNQSCMTAEGARARIDADDGHVILEPHTAVAVERVRPLRMRLFEGTLIVRGTCVITGRSAVIEARDGDGWISYDGSELRVGVARGSLCVTDPDGEHVVSAGSVWTQSALSGNPADG